MADSCCIVELKEIIQKLNVELKEIIEKLNVELSQSHAKIAELNAKVKEQEEENTRLTRDLKECEEKCRATQERLKFAEQKLAQFSHKPQTAAQESLAQIRRNLIIDRSCFSSDGPDSDENSQNLITDSSSSCSDGPDSDEHMISFPLVIKYEKSGVSKSVNSGVGKSITNIPHLLKRKKFDEGTKENNVKTSKLTNILKGDSKITYNGTGYELRNKRGRPRAGEKASPSHYLSMDRESKLSLDFVQQCLDETHTTGGASNFYVGWPAPIEPQDLPIVPSSQQPTSEHKDEHIALSSSATLPWDFTPSQSEDSSPNPNIMNTININSPVTNILVSPPPPPPKPKSPPPKPKSKAETSPVQEPAKCVKKSRQSDSRLRGLVEQFIPQEGFLYLDEGKVMYQLPSGGRNAVVVLQQLGPKISEDKMGFLKVYSRYAEVRKETRFQRIFSPSEDFKNIPHRCFLPEGYSRGIKRWPKSADGLRVTYFNSKWPPNTCTSLVEIRKSLNKHFSAPYPAFMQDFSPYLCYCKSEFEDPATYFYPD